VVSVRRYFCPAKKSQPTPHQSFTFPRGRNVSRQSQFLISPIERTSPIPCACAVTHAAGNESPQRLRCAKRLERHSLRARNSPQKMRALLEAGYEDGGCGGDDTARPGRRLGGDEYPALIQSAAQDRLTRRNRHRHPKHRARANRQKDSGKAATHRRRRCGHCGYGKFRIES